MSGKKNEKGKDVDDGSGDNDAGGQFEQSRSPRGGSLPFQECQGSIPSKISRPGVPTRLLFRSSFYRKSSGISFAIRKSQPFLYAKNAIPVDVLRPAGHLPHSGMAGA